MSAISRFSGWLWFAQRPTARSAPRRGCHPGNPSHPSAFTLVEMLIAMALTLILVYAIAEFYAYVGNTVKDGRAMIEMNGQMRIATARLKADLELLTVPVVPWADDGSGEGYFEIREGAGSDLDALTDANTNSIPDYTEVNATTATGDLDDFLAFTIRSNGTPLVGQTVQIDFSNTATQGSLLLDANSNPQPTALSSSVAEVAWWTSFTDTSGDLNWNPGEPRFLQRRQLLVRPDLNRVYPNDSNYSGSYFVRIANTNVAEAYYYLLQWCDVSVHPIGVNSGYTYFVANSLVDLMRRENRFMHVPGPPAFPATTFPNLVDLNSNYYGDVTQLRSAAANNASQWRWTLAGERTGEDKVLSNVLGFDIRVFDPTAPIRADGELTDTNSNPDDDARGTVQPGDPGWAAAVNANSSNANQCPIVGFGAYVDLYYNGYPSLPPAAQVSSTFSSAGVQTGLSGVYDTWALSYERDGIDQNGDGVLDSSTDGLDNNGINGVDDAGERETSPPYPVPLRGIQVRLRLYEPGTRQVRQATVGADFIRE